MNDTLTHAIIGAALEVHRTLGPGLLESIYEEALCIELQLRGLKVQQQVAIDVMYKGHIIGHIIKGQRLDLLVEDQVIVELKAVSILHAAATAQLLSYLKATGLKRGLLINFGVPRLVDGIKRLSV